MKRYGLGMIPGRRGLAGGLLALLLGLGGAHPALAQFTTREGFAADGSPAWRVEVQPYLFLPAIQAKVGLARVPSLDPTFSQPRPTLADVAAHLNGAFTCDCLVRHGNWSGEVNINYISASGTKTSPPILPGGPGRELSSKAAIFEISPGIGYQVVHSDKVALDLRGGFSYSSIDANANFAGTRLPEASRSTSLIQPWIGERTDYYPSPKWRLENTLAITGLGVNAGAVGWNARVGVSYLIARWFDVSAGYAASQTSRNQISGPFGGDNSVNVLQYGPYMAMGFRF